MLMVIVIGIVGCGPNEKELDNQIQTLQEEIRALETQKEKLENEIVDTKVENGTAKYVITFEIKQSHFSLDLGKHLKDAMNAIEIEIPVDKEYFDSVEVGDAIMMIFVLDLWL